MLTGLHIPVQMAGFRRYATAGKLRPWLALLAAEILCAGAAFATLFTGQPPSITSDRVWFGLFVLAALGSAIIAASFAVCLRFLGKLSESDALRRAALAMTPVIIGGLLTAVAGLVPEFAENLRIIDRLRLLIGLGLMVVLGGSMWATALWTADEGRGWLRRLPFGRIPAGLAGLAAFLVLIVCGGGHLYSPDTWAVYAVTHSIATRGSLLVSDNDPYPLRQMGIRVVTAVDDVPAGYSKWPLLQSVAATPAYLLARAVGSEPDDEFATIANEKRGRPLVPLLVGPAWAAGAAAAVVWLLRGAGYGIGSALVVVLLMVFATPWWPYAKTLFNVVPAGCLLLVALGAAVRCSPGKWRWPLVAGVTGGLAVAARYELLLLIAPVGLIIAARCWPAHRLSLPRRALLPLIACASAWAGTVAFAVLLPNAVTRGDPLDFGYGGQQTLAAWNNDPHIGIYGILMSPGFGLLVYAPILALAALSLVWMREDAPLLAAVIAAIALGFVVFYGSFQAWQAGLTWGPRYLVTIVPLLCLPLAAFIKRNAHNSLAMFVLAGLGLYGFVVNGLAVLIDFNRGWLNLWTLGASPWHVVWTPHFSPIGAQLRLLHAWYAHSYGSFDLFLVAHAGWLAVVLLAIAIALFVGVARAGVSPAASVPSER